MWGALAGAAANFFTKKRGGAEDTGGRSYLDNIFGGIGNFLGRRAGGAADRFFSDKVEGIPSPGESQREFMNESIPGWDKLNPWEKAGSGSAAGQAGVAAEQRRTEKSNLAKQLHQQRYAVDKQAATAIEVAKIQAGPAQKQADTARMSASINALINSKGGNTMWNSAWSNFLETIGIKDHSKILDAAGFNNMSEVADEYAGGDDAKFKQIMTALVVGFVLYKGLFRLGGSGLNRAAMRKYVDKQVAKRFALPNGAQKVSGAAGNFVSGMIKAARRAGQRIKSRVDNIPGADF